MSTDQTLGEEFLASEDARRGTPHDNDETEQRRSLCVTGVSTRYGRRRK
jgi:hypothetical protein